MIKLRNTTADFFKDELLDVRLAPYQTAKYEELYLETLDTSDYMIESITNGTIVLNDGNHDLLADEAVDIIQNTTEGAASVTYTQKAIVFLKAPFTVINAIGSYQAVPFTSDHVGAESKSSLVYSSVTNPENIYVGVDGLFLINYSFTVRNLKNKACIAEAIVKLNGSNIQDTYAMGTTVSSWGSGTPANVEVSSIPVELTKGDYVTLYWKADHENHDLLNGIAFSLVLLQTYI